MRPEPRAYPGVTGSVGGAKLSLRALGPVDLLDADGAPALAVLAQPKRFALLIYLVVAQPRGFHQRDELLALFWPESDAGRARNALNQALSYLRQHLPRGVLRVRGSGVGVDPALVRCDVHAFEAAADSGDPAAAVDLYGGPFLHAFHVPDAPGFDAWADTVRDDLRERAGDAAWRMAWSALARGSAVEGERAAQRAIALLPTDETAAVEFMEGLCRAGDRAAAVRFYERFRSRLRAELELEPSSESRRRFEVVRSGELPCGLSQPAPGPEPDRGGVQAAAATDPPQGAGGGRPPGPEVAEPSRHARTAEPRFRRTLILGTSAAVVIALAAVLIPRGSGAPGAGVIKVPTIAVLPLANRSGEAGDARFADGLHAEILTRMGRLPGVRVLSRNAVLPFRSGGSADDLRRALGVDYIVEAGVARAGDSIRLDVRLVATATSAQIWAEVHDAELTPATLLELQSRIASRVAESVHWRVAAGSGASVASRRGAAAAVAPEPAGTSSAEAYEWYLRGAGIPFAGYLERDIRYAIHCHEQAVALDPSFGVAWARLSMAHGELYWFFEPTPARAEASFSALDRARALAPGHPEIRLAGGVHKYRVLRDYPGALAEIEAAGAAMPGDPRIHHLLGAIYRRSGRWGQALSSWEHALALDPRSATAEMEVGLTHWLMRAYDPAVEHLRRALSLDPSLVTAAAVLGWATLSRDADPAEGSRIIGATALAGTLPSENPYGLYSRVLLELLADRPAAALAILELERREFLEYQYLAVPTPLLRGQILRTMGRVADADAEFKRARSLLEQRLGAPGGADDPRLHAALGVTLAWVGEAGEAIRHARRAVDLLPVERDAWFGAYYLEDWAMVHAILRDEDTAIPAFERLLSNPGPTSRAQLRLDPRLAALRRNPRFQALLDGG